MEASAAIADQALLEASTRPSSTRRRYQRRRIRELLPDGLWGMAEVADELGVTVSNLHHIKDLPEPIMRCRATRLWLPDDIRDFAVLYKARRPGPRSA